MKIVVVILIIVIGFFVHWQIAVNKPIIMVAPGVGKKIHDRQTVYMNGWVYSVTDVNRTKGTFGLQQAYGPVMPEDMRQTNCRYLKLSIDGNLVKEEEK